MPRLATVILKRKRDGQQLIINAFDYQRNINRWSRSYTYVGYRRGDAEVDDERRAAFEAKLNQHRLENPDESKKRGDKRRTHEAQSIEREIKTDRRPVGRPPLVKPEEDSTDPADAWRKLRWFQRAALVFKETGSRPKDMAEAEKLMAEKKVSSP